MTHEQSRAIRDTILSLHRAGLSAAAISDTMGLPLKYVRNKLYGARVGKRERKNLRDQVLPLVKQGLDRYEVAAHLGIKTSQVAYIANLYGLKIARKKERKKREWPLGKAVEVIELLKTAKTGNDVAKATNLTRQRVNQIKHRAMKEGLL